MNRRRFLSALGAATGTALAGCIGNNQLGLNDVANVQNGELRLVDARAPRLLAARGFVHVRVSGGAEEQYLLFIFDVSELDVENPQDYVRNNIQFQVSPDTVLPSYSGGTPIFLVDDETRVAVIFEVSAPYDVPMNARLNWRGEASHVWDAARILDAVGVDARLRIPPDFNVLSFEASRTSASQATASVRVSNTGTSPGTFRCLLGSAALSGQPLRSFDVASGEIVQKSFDLQLYRDGKEETISLDWGEEAITRTV